MVGSVMGSQDSCDVKRASIQFCYASIFQIKVTTGRLCPLIKKINSGGLSSVIPSIQVWNFSGPLHK